MAVPTVLTTGLVVVHAAVAALWFGAMAYSLFVVQPRLPQLAGAGDSVRVEGDVVRVEDAHRTLAAGNRWPVVAMITLLWLTGGGLVAVGAPDGGAAWWAGVAVKAGLLAAASAIFWWVSWRAWPRRVFALPAELPARHRRFRAAAVVMLTLVGAAFVLGTLAS